MWRIQGEKGYEMSQIIINKDGYTLFKGFHVVMYMYLYYVYNIYKQRAHTTGFGFGLGLIA